MEDLIKTIRGYFQEFFEILREVHGDQESIERCYSGFGETLRMIEEGTLTFPDFEESMSRLEQDWEAVAVLMNETEGQRLAKWRAR